MDEPKYVGRLPFSEPPGHPDANRDWHSVATEWVWENYFHGLGYLMHSYSRVEANLNLTISTFVKEKLRVAWSNSPDPELRIVEAKRSIERDELIQAILGAQRPAQAKETLKRLLRVTKAEPHVRTRVDEILSHFSTIGKFRDMLAHNAPDHDQTNKKQIFILRNTYLVNEKSKEMEFKFPSELLVRAAWDLANMPDFLSEVLWIIDYDDPLINPGGGRPPSYWELHGGWKCKASELTPPQRSHHAPR